MNIDLGRPIDYDALGRFKHVRINYDVSQDRGDTNIETIHASLYKPALDALRSRGVKALFVGTHELYGEGQGFNWEQMSDADWQRFTDGYVEMCRRWAQLCKGSSVVYQIMNEQDSQEPRASVIVPPPVYGQLFNRAYDAIKAIDTTASVITGGYNSGSGRGTQQYREAKITRTDGVAFHPYGLTANGDFDVFGAFKPQLDQWATLGQPLWVSEYGVLGHNNDASSNRVANWIIAMRGTMRGRVAGECYFSWHIQDAPPYDSFGVVDQAGNVRQPVYNALTVGSSPVPIPPDPSGGAAVRYAVSVNLRSMPTTQGAISTVIPAGGQATIFEGALEVADGYVWVKTQYAGFSGWTALVKNQTFALQ